MRERWGDDMGIGIVQVDMFLSAQPREDNQALLVLGSSKGPFEDLIHRAKSRGVAFVVLDDLHTFRNINKLRGRMFSYVYVVNVEPQHSFMQAVYSRMFIDRDTSIHFFNTRTDNGK
ncbi:hypothetical protein D1872_72640 [compost metagenome]